MSEKPVPHYIAKFEQRTISQLAEGEELKNQIKAALFAYKKKHGEFPKTLGEAAKILKRTGPKLTSQIKRAFTTDTNYLDVISILEREGREEKAKKPT